MAGENLVKTQKTPTLKGRLPPRQWWLIDAEGLVLGRTAAEIARLLRGKHKPTFSPHRDCGDSVVVVNAEKIGLTGNKANGRVHYRHTGYPGGIRSQTAGSIRSSAHPDRLIVQAVKRMLTWGPLTRTQLTHLRVYAGREHPHEANNPVKIDLAARNPKNQVRSVRRPVSE